MYASNMVLGMLFAKARNVRRKDVFLDGVLAGSVKSPAAAFVLVAALSPKQGKHSHVPMPTITGVAPTGTSTKIDSGANLAISGTNFGTAGNVIVSFQYVGGDGFTGETQTQKGTVVAPAGASPTITVSTPDMGAITTGSAQVNVAVIVGGRTSNQFPVTYNAD
jgi:hypothetical protein